VSVFALNAAWTLSIVASTTSKRAWANEVAGARVKPTVAMNRQRMDFLVRISVNRGADQC
jgi:hypothetical protein